MIVRSSREFLLLRAPYRRLETYWIKGMFNGSMGESDA